MRDGATAPDRGGLWPVPFTAHEKRVIRTQAKYDRRSIPPIWLWPIAQPEAPQGTDVNDTFWESVAVEGGGRRHGSPVAAHIYVDWLAEKKARYKGVTMTKGTVKLGISRAEVRRLGIELKERNAVENLWSAADESVEVRGVQVPVPGGLEFLFIPTPGSVFRWGNRYYRVNQWEPKYEGATDMLVVLEGTATQIAEDSTSPGMPTLEQPESFRPERPVGTPEGVRG